MTLPVSEQSSAGLPSRTSLVGILEIRPDLLEEILDAAAALFREERVVYLTDDDDFTALRRRGAVFEYVPSLSAQTRLGHGMPWRSYLRERWTVLLDRWKPHRIVAFGTGIEAFINAAARDPAERSSASPDLGVRSRLQSVRIGGQDQGV